jgi:hypothetical protein
VVKKTKYEKNEQGEFSCKHKILLLYFYELENLRRLLAKEKIKCNFTLFTEMDFPKFFSKKTFHEITKNC